ncbi:Small multidrug resistance protein OS=Tsukamurella paurometabola (strain ATCC 8368 / DSM / CCUG 35730 / CIP 100753 / JCM 10117 / KCTC 9821 / NBRC 16120/ NCIMB 702349 / NCTC 13040) OX=521096 GN=Tpau_2410 PE=3 SV=1 [Tsukamurella paurometabola]|uniref:Small multidrug resistance protein n=1 Tax=Tsukamurella paurometabola (strain ATCC 8368 / DSM 20162 / CCUG 35730 / CIP 100753 / JCM 10117 / KCTC 9821 / NBRC 16120 / NCIMB 702349 / NCTC 13040) TaxID=521096 RepID=D5UR27_TSUPD|nr:multidrug efflux SMR transporter [Tsukamurella paurometabola]ADG79016.1 small multidrug resistance protein [Tsukamurella paurometabola DSM 20162]SUP33785.1 Multidrug resistance protein EbrB [Tsukamurella paurometabola]
MSRTAAILLFLAIVCEVAATLSLRATDGFKNLWPLLIVVPGYIGAFAFLGLSLREISVGVAYAIWSAAGTVLITVGAAVLFHDRISWVTMVGMAVTITGVVIINLSGSGGH